MGRSIISGRAADSGIPHPAGRPQPDRPYLRTRKLEGGANTFCRYSGSPPTILGELRVFVHFAWGRVRPGSRLQDLASNDALMSYHNFHCTNHAIVFSDLHCYTNHPTASVTWSTGDATAQSHLQAQELDCTYPDSPWMQRLPIPPNH